MEDTVKCVQCLCESGFWKYANKCICEHVCVCACVWGGGGCQKEALLRTVKRVCVCVRALRDRRGVQTHNWWPNLSIYRATTGNTHTHTHTHTVNLGTQNRPEGTKQPSHHTHSPQLTNACRYKRITNWAALQSFMEPDLLFSVTLVSDLCTHTQARRTHAQTRTNTCTRCREGSCTLPLLWAFSPVM